jgi:hypothetical protein
MLVEFLPNILIAIPTPRLCHAVNRTYRYIYVSHVGFGVGINKRYINFSAPLSSFGLKVWLKTMGDDEKRTPAPALIVGAYGSVRQARTNLQKPSLPNTCLSSAAASTGVNN